MSGQSRIGGWLLAKIGHPIEAALTVLAYGIFRLLPLDLASAVGGAMVRWIGPHLGVNAVARRNIRFAMPELDADAIERIVCGMWDNCGRLIGEFSHMRAFRIGGADRRLDVVGIEWVDALRDGGVPAIFFSGHIANFALLPWVLTQRVLPFVFVYRAPNNRLIEWLYRYYWLRAEVSLIRKGSAGARLLLRARAEGKHLGMLVDQKMNDGIAVPFFGRLTMTASSLATLALRYRCPVVPVRIERLRGARFRVTIGPPLALPDSGDREADVYTLMAAVNARLEAWIRERPEQWLWLHNRWPDRG